MNRYVFLVPNQTLERITVIANNEEEARAKMKDFEVEEYETIQNDYDFYDADLQEFEEDV